MDSTSLINSLGIGAAIFAGLVLLWFLRIFFKRRMTDQHAKQTLAALGKTSWEEKRKHPRVAVSWPARIETSQDSKSVQLKDISMGGAFVVCADPLPLSEKLRLSISTPDQESFTLNAEVVWSNVNVPADKVINRGMGVRFIENTDEQRGCLNHAIKSYIEESAE